MGVVFGLSILLTIIALIVYAHINDFRNFGGNEQNKRATQAA